MTEHTTSTVEPTDMRGIESANDRIHAPTGIEFANPTHETAFDRRNRSGMLLYRRVAHGRPPRSSVVEAARTQAAAPVEQITSIPGNVLAISDVSVQCALTLPNERRMVELPLALFSDAPPWVGQPFSLAMTEIDGIRAPRISAREPNFEHQEELRREIFALLDELEPD